MDIKTAKINLAQKILETEDVNIIKMVSEIFEDPSNDKDFWDNLTVVQQNEINEGIRDIESENIVNFDDFLKKHKSA